jgi:hypothetical protein
MRPKWRFRLKALFTTILLIGAATALIRSMNVVAIMAGFTILTSTLGVLVTSALGCEPVDGFTLGVYGSIPIWLVVGGGVWLFVSSY